MIELISQMDTGKITKNQVKFLQSLKLKKYKQKYNKYTMEGEKIVLDLLSFNSNLIDKVILTEQAFEKHSAVILEFPSKLLIATSKNMEMMSQLKKPSSMMALCNIDNTTTLPDKLIPGRYIYLENIQDPGNLGTILRTADWFGYDGMILSNQSVDIYNQKVIQSSMGSFFRMKHAYVDADKFASIELPKIATTLSGENLQEFQFPEHFILCMGNEGQGLQESTVAICDSNILILDNYSLGAESLNVSISASIFMHTEAISRKL